MFFYVVVKMRFDIGLHVVVYSNSNKAPPEFAITLPGLACNKLSVRTKKITYREEKGRAKAGTQFPLPIPS